MNAFDNQSPEVPFSLLITILLSGDHMPLFMELYYYESTRNEGSIITVI